MSLQTTAADGGFAPMYFSWMRFQHSLHSGDDSAAGWAGGPQMPMQFCTSSGVGAIPSTWKLQAGIITKTLKWLYIAFYIATRNQHTQEDYKFHDLVEILIFSQSLLIDCSTGQNWPAYLYRDHNPISSLITVNNT